MLAEVPLREDRGAGPRTVKLVSFSKSGNHRPVVKKLKVLGNELNGASRDEIAVVKGATGS